MAVREQMMRVLRNTDAQRIHFSFAGSTLGTISVNGSSFRNVAQAIEEDRIQVTEGGVPGGWANYDARKNTFNVGPDQHWSGSFDALVIHESVHAAFDLARASLPWLDNEIAAYMAQGYYLRNSGFGANRLDHVGETNQPYLGLQIIQSIVSEGRIDPFWLEQLRGSLLSSPQYHSYIRGTFTGDG